MDPELVWYGKEGGALRVDTVSLHLHERIDPKTIIGKTLKRATHVQERLTFHFEREENDTPLKEDAMRFYKHSHGWSNRMIAGDSLLVMNSLLRKEDYAGEVQFVYMDPPYGVKYGSNFQPFVNRKDVRDGNSDDLTREPEMVKAFRDTWGLEIHSYLSYMRDRLLLARELLRDSGSCAVQISDDNLHYVRSLMDEVFGRDNFIGIISFQKTTNATSKHMQILFDYIVWYAKDKEHLKYHKLFYRKQLPVDHPTFRHVQLQDGTRRAMTREERTNPLTTPPGSRLYRHDNIQAAGDASRDASFTFRGERFTPARGMWRVSLDGMRRLAEKNRIVKSGNILHLVTFFDDFEYSEFGNMWNDTHAGGFEGKVYVVQTTAKVIRRMVLMATDPGDLVLDPTCGSGTTAYVAEQTGRRWVTCDTSRVAIALAKRRLMTAIYRYYALNDPDLGPSSGFSYEEAARTTVRSLAYDEDPERVTLYDRPAEDRSLARVSGPFTVEAVPAPTALSADVDYEGPGAAPDPSAGERERQERWRDELLSTGILGRTVGGKKQKIEFKSVDRHPSSLWLHARAVTNEAEPRTVMVSFGPAHAPLGRRQVEGARREVLEMSPRPSLAVFAGLQMDPVVSDELRPEKWGGVQALQAQMNPDLLVEDLKKGKRDSESFLLIGQPDVELARAPGGRYRVAVRGFDYYNTRSNRVESGGPGRIAMWMLDTDYDGRSLYPQQAFFPAEREGEGWWRDVKRRLRRHIDEGLFSAYSGTESLEFELGGHRRVAVKIVDDRGVESMRIIGAGP